MSDETPSPAPEVVLRLTREDASVLSDAVLDALAAAIKGTHEWRGRERATHYRVEADALEVLRQKVAAALSASSPAPAVSAEQIRALIEKWGKEAEEPSYAGDTAVALNQCADELERLLR